MKKTYLINTKSNTPNLRKYGAFVLKACSVEFLTLIYFIKYLHFLRWTSKIKKTLLSFR